jgi:hypothetical protein
MSGELLPRNNSAVYFLVRTLPDHMSYIAIGISPIDVPDLHLYSIQRASPNPSDHDLTAGLVRLQRLWRIRRRIIKWHSHPSRLFYREQTGAFPTPVSHNPRKTYRVE